MSEDPFESPKLLIESAREEIDDFRARERAFFDSKPHTRIIDTDSETGDKLHKVRLVRPVPGRMRTVVSDATNNLRHALDQAVYWSAVVLGASEDIRRTYFPFAESPSDLEGRLKRGSSQDAAPEIHALLTSFEPYLTGDTHKGGNNLLRALGYIAGTNKHRLVLDVGVNTNAIHIKSLIIKKAKTMGVPAPNWDRDKHEITFLRHAAGDEFEYEIAVPFYVAFGDVEVIGFQPVIPVLDRLLGIVNGIVSAIEAETLRVLASRG